MRASLAKVRFPLACAVLAALPLCFVFLFQEEVSAPSRAPVSSQPENAVYAWQLQWSSSVSASIEKAAPATDSFMVLGAEYALEGGQLRARTSHADWRRFAQVNRPVWIVLRAQVIPGIEQAEARRTAAKTLATTAHSLLDSAREAGAPLRGIQLDYDCATGDLPYYAAFLAAFRGEIPDVPFAITALPTWLRQPAFLEILQGLDHYVLQVHSLERPDRVDKPATLCDTSLAAGWIRDAAALGRPFYLALPTYGYRLFFDASGAFAGLGAEEPEETYTGCTTREIRADPAAIAALVRTLRADPPPQWRGFAWFRLPVDGDRLNWTWPVLAAVMQGQAPQAELSAELRSPSPGLYEVWVRNNGAFRPLKPIRIGGDWITAPMAARDALGGFRFAEGPPHAAASLTGPAPCPGEETMAAWFRLAEETHPPDSACHVLELETSP